VFFSFFQSRAQRKLDQHEALMLRTRYGDSAKSVVIARANNEQLPSRDRNHWKRISRWL
jgi:hypothetical protein